MRVCLETSITLAWHIFFRLLLLIFCLGTETIKSLLWTKPLEQTIQVEKMTTEGSVKLTKTKTLAQSVDVVWFEINDAFGNIQKNSLSIAYPICNYFAGWFSLCVIQRIRKRCVISQSTATNNRIDWEKKLRIICVIHCANEIGWLNPDVYWITHSFVSNARGNLESANGMPNELNCCTYKNERLLIPFPNDDANTTIEVFVYAIVNNWF